MDVSLEGKNTCKAAWTVHVSKLRAIGMAICKARGIPTTGFDLKIASEDYLGNRAHLGN